MSILLLHSNLQNLVINNFEEQYIVKLLNYYKKYSKQPNVTDFDINFLQERLSKKNSSQKLTPTNIDQN